MRSYFPKLYDNRRSAAMLGAAVENNNLSHALLIVGPSGSGKSTLAGEIAMAVNCEKRGDGAYPLPCGFCNTCRRIRGGNFPDVKYLEKQKERATIGVEAVKDFREDMFLSATEADKKIYIIDSAHTMTPEAQNALLKVLEEPPTSVLIMMLCSEPDRILTTVKSRAQLITMEKISNERLREYILSASEEARLLKSTDGTAFDALILASDNVIGNALRLTSKKEREQILLEREITLGFLRALCGRIEYSRLSRAVAEIPSRTRGELGLALEEIIKAARDLIAVKATGKQAKMLFFTSPAEADELSRAIGTPRLLRLVDILNGAIKLNSMNANIQSILANITAELRFRENH